MPRWILAVCLFWVLAAPALAAPVMLISIDGLRPADVIEAEAKGLNLPNLSRFVREGSYASGVTGVLPTVTYPSHTTLITGVSPAKHGIGHNLAFDPLQLNQSGWTWYASDIKVPTLWEAASRAGIKAANVHWPVSVGARGTAWNLPQIWRTGHADDAKLLGALATPGLIAELERATGETYPQGIDESLAADTARGRFAEALVRLHRPGLITVYLASLDHQQHADGPDAASARAVLASLDAIVGRLVAAQRAAHPDGVVALVSDHGFRPVERETSLFHAFIDAGLIGLDAQGKVTRWEAMPTSEDGSVAVILAGPDDPGLIARVGHLLADLKADPASGIERIAGREEIARLGGNPQASFWVGFAPGTAGADFHGASGPLYGKPQSGGTHGYFPSDPAMRSTFMMLGKGIPKGRNLGEIDMRAIAPTLARIMGAKLETAEKPPLAF
jgi:predicted AlkP superfamily pyrophosphatase or phosphodiesterase